MFCLQDGILHVFNTLSSKDLHLFWNNNFDFCRGFLKYYREENVPHSWEVCYLFPVF